MLSKQEINRKLLKDFWSKKLSETTDYSFDTSSRKEGSTKSYTTDINSIVSDKIKSIANNNEVAEYIIYLAYFHALLDKYSLGSTLFVTSGGIKSADVRQMLFFKLSLSENSSLKDLFQSTRKEVQETLTYKDISLEEINKIAAKNSFDENVLYQFGFGYNKITTQTEELSRVVLNFEIIKEGENYKLEVKYHEPAYKEAFVKQMAAHYNHLLSLTLGNIDILLKDVKILSKEERLHILHGFNNTHTPYPAHSSLPELFEEQAALYPESIALVFEGKTYTYRQLNESSNQLAHYLRNEFSIKPDDLVGLLVNRSERMIIAILGILKAGGAYLPIDPDYPKDRKSYMLNDAKIKVLLTDSDIMFETQDYYQGPLFALDIQLTGLSESRENPAISNKASDLAYVMYTSGSTGEPKGVAIEHKSVVRLVRNTNYVTIEYGAKLVQTGALTFDATTFEIWGTLLNGGELHLLNHDDLMTISSLKSYLITNKIDMIWFTASWFNELADADISLFSNLKFLLVGGDKLSTHHINKVRAAYPALKIINGYGPTENTTFSICHQIDHLYDGDIPIGKPISNSSAYILDAHLEPVPVGVEGEIYVGGDGLARGYWLQENLTNEKFITHAFDTEALQRLYRTGDLGRYLSDGTIEFRGRKDSQIKLRGYRIEPGEIENALLKYPGVEKVLVKVIEDKSGEKQLAAFLTGIAGEDQAEIRTYLADCLPQYMIPAYLVTLPTFPLTVNGKIDHKALPDPETITEKIYINPTNELEQKLADIWKEVLRKERIGIDNNFFEMGGHSLKATQLVSRIYKTFHVKIDLGSIFNCPTIREQAAIIADTQKMSYEPVTPVYGLEYYELSHAQKRLWVMDQIESDLVAYNMPGAYELTGRLDIPALRKSFETLVSRHESLRTSFITLDGTPYQKIHEPSHSGFQFGYLDLRAESEAETAARSLANEEAQAPFNLATGPLLRVRLLQLEEERFILLFTLHHIISDGWSMEILLREILVLYKAFKEGHDNPLQLLKVQYKDYAAWQRRQLEGEQLERHRSYWLSQFKGEIPLLEFPSDKPRPSVKTYNGDIITAFIDQKIKDDLKKLAAEKDSSLYMVLMASLKSLLFRYTGQEDIIVGFPIAGREHADLEDQIGFYINNIALRTTFAGTNTFEHLLDNIRRNTLEAYEHQIYPFDSLVDELSPGRDMSRSPLFDVVMVLQNTDISKEAEEMEGITVRGYFTDKKISKYDFILEFREIEEGLIVNMEYNTDLYYPSTIHRFISHYTGILKAVLKDPATALNKLDYLSSEEKSQLLQTGPSKQPGWPQQKTISQCFEEQVQKSPASISLTYNGKSLSYEELNVYSNKLAHFLRIKYNITPDDKIGLLMERSEQMVIAILAVLKAGGAYVPIDPAYPKERVNFILSDIQAKAVIVADRTLADQFEIDESKQIVPIEICAENYPSSDLLLSSESNDLAYIIYTSGSTGEPKGVMVEHRNVLSLILHETLPFDFKADDVWSLFHSTSFDFSVWEIFGCLLNGGRLVIVPKEIARDPSAFVDLIESQGITILNQVPTMFSNVMAEAQGRKQLEVKLRYVIFGGEALNPGSLKNWHLRYPSVKLVNMYGITETTVHVTYKEIREQEIQSGISNIGNPLETLKIYLLDENRQLVPQGVAGEIAVSGAGVSRGYLNRASLNQERFIPNPYNEKELLYLSGDLAIRRSEGDLIYIGRKDSQVKIRGYRIELGEIKKALITYPAIEDAVVIARPDKEGINYLIAYFLSNEAVSPLNLRNYLAGLLPEHMLPAYFIRLEAFPVTGNGKVDVKALPSPQKLDQEGGIGYEAPRNTLEAQLVKIWENNLERRPVGIRDNYFAIGGDSIKAIRMVSSINLELGIKVEVKDIFQNQDIESLAIHINESKGGEAEQQLSEAKKSVEALKNAVEQDQELSAFLPVDYEDFYPMSDIEKGMIYHSMLSAASGVYHDQMFYQIEDQNFDYKIFTNAVKLMAEKHAILRTGFDLEHFPYPMQIVHKANVSHLDLTFQDLTTHSPEQQKEYLTSFLKDDRDAGFDISRAGLWRMRIFQLAEAEYGIIFICHHAIIDGWSDASMMTELSNIYYNLKENIDYKPSRIKADYKDYIIDQYRYKHSEEVKAFWQQYLKGYQRASLPFGKTLSNVKGDGVSTNHLFTVNKSLQLDLQKLSKQKKISPKYIYLSAFLYLIRLTANIKDLTIGLVTNGRPEVEDGDKILGCFLNTIPFRVQLEGETKKEELLSRVNATGNELKAYDKLSLMEIMSATGEGTSGENPFFDIIFNFIDFHIYDQSHEQTIKKESIVAGHVRTNTVFDFHVSRVGAEMVFSIGYIIEMYTTEEVKRLSDYYERILVAIVSEEQSALSTSAIIGAEENELLLKSFNHTDVSYSCFQTVTELFETQARRTPQASAVVFDGRHYTYEELNHKSNQLADFLIKEYHIQHNEPVGVLLKRSERNIIAMIAIMKAGACYVPIDPDYPLSRIHFILEDIKSKVILTEDKVLPDLSELSFDFVSIDHVEFSKYSGQNPGVSIQGSDLSYLIYTSGSTGQPKGVMQTHLTLYNLMRWQMDYSDIGHGLRQLQYTSFSFDVSLQDVYYALSTGGTLYVVGEELRLDFELLKEFFIYNKIEVLSLPFSVLSNFFNRNSKEDLQGHNMKDIITSGEQLLVGKNLEEFLEVYPGVKLHNHYGPSETHVVTSYTMSAGYNNISKRPPIGKPVSNTQIYILDDEYQPVPFGVPGEIYIGGHNLGEGYLHRSDLTIQRFIALQVADEEAKILYKSGDIGRWLSGGNIEYIGRKDNQIKIRGFRIEMGEIENVLLKNPIIKEAVVLLKEDDKNTPHLVAYYISDEELTHAQLRTYLGASLPDYMIPAYFKALLVLPLTSNGKIDHRALPGIAELSLDGYEEYAAPASETEEKLVIIWQMVLAREKIGVKDNFFALGGDSLKAIQLVGLINKEFNIHIELKKIFTLSTIEAIASEVDAIAWLTNKHEDSNKEGITEEIII